MEFFQSLYNFFTSPLFHFLLRLLGLFIILIWLSLVFWTYRDAKKRGSFAFSWATAVFFFNFFGWLIYLILRPPEYLEEVKDRELDIRTKETQLKKQGLHCPACFRPCEEDFQVCPYCFKKLKKPCPNCNRLLKLDWAVCPYCRTTL